MNSLLDKATLLPRLQQKPNTNSNSSNDELRQKLHRLRQKRKQIHNARQNIQNQQIAINKKLSDIKSKRQIVVEAYQSVLQQRNHISNFLFVSEKWNVINDCFHIWYQGPFATILNARLGLQAPNFQYNLDSNNYLDSGSELSTSQRTHHQQQQQQLAAAQPPTRRSYFLWPSLAATAPVNDSSTPSMTSSSFSSSPNIGNTAITANITTNVSPKSSTGGSTTAINSTRSNANNSMIVVPWPEINTAIGHVVLLLIILQEKVGFTFTHTLVAQSSTSKIMIQKKTAYNLYFDDADVGVFMGRGYLMRNFHLALQALLQCVSEASRQLVDKTIVLPHVITRGSSDDTAATTTNTTGEWKIGGLSINPDNTTAAAAAAAATADQSSQSQQQFTRACKYLLTDMKWLVAYTVKHHVDR